MIKDKKELSYYLKCDSIAMHREYKRPRFIHDNIWKYQILLRKCEYYNNIRRNLIDDMVFRYLKLKFTVLGQHLGFSIPLNVFGPGLCIEHYGSIVVNINARIGANCRIHEGTTIGANGLFSDKAPVIGDNVYNYGASLQAYALMKYLQDKGNDVEIIDYKPTHLSGRYSFWFVPDDTPFKRICDKSRFAHLAYAVAKFHGRFQTIKRKKKFNQFKTKLLSITSISYSSNASLKENVPQADLYITGSDQVWNSVMQNGKDPAFYLDFVPGDKRKISYAASFGTDYIQKGYESLTKNMLSRFQNISVREDSGLRILDSLGITGTRVLDPVFLLSKDEWKNLIKKTYSEKYILVYDFIYDSEIRATVKMIAKLNGWKIYSINDYKNIKYADKNISNAGPIEFLEWINSSQMVISNSFHATAFSIILQKEFFVFNIKTLNNNSRMSDLLASLNLSKRHIFSMNDVLLEEKIDYSKVKEFLNPFIDYSRCFLNQICN